jgi:hypothetical protein
VGRYINCKIGDEYETVWKYGFGVQNSEMHRITTELGIGEYHVIRYIYDDETEECNPNLYEYVPKDRIEVDENGDLNVDGDILILSRSDLEKLEEQIQSLKKTDLSEGNEWFIAMIEAIRDFIVEHSEQDRFVFAGEF